MRIAYGLLQRKPEMYTIAEMALDLFNYDGVQFRRLVKSHFYHARIYLQDTYGEVVIPVRLGSRTIAGYKCADAENEEDVRAVKHEVLRRGLMSQSAAQKFDSVIEAVKTQQMLKGGQFGSMQRMIEGEVESRAMKKEEQYELHGFRLDEVIPLEHLERNGRNMKMAVTLYAENVFPAKFVFADVKMALEASGIQVKSEDSLRTLLSQLTRPKGTLTKEKFEGGGNQNRYQARTGAK